MTIALISGLAALVATWTCPYLATSQPSAASGPAATSAPASAAAVAESQPDCAPASASAPASEPTAATVVSEIAIEIDYPRGGEEAELLHWLGVERGARVTAADVHDLEERLLELGRYRAAVCRLVDAAGGSRLVCSVSTVRTVRRVRYQGIPGRILQAELAKRVFIRPGQRVDQDEVVGRDTRLARQRKRIAEYLEREGVFGAAVDIAAEPVAGDPRAVDLLITIDGGHAVAVRRIDVVGAGPIAAAEIQESLRPGPWSVFTPVALREQIAQLERRHRTQRNYPETQISAKYKVDLEELAVDIAVRISTGTHLDVVLTGDVWSDRNELLRLLTFADAAAVDATEVENGRRALHTWLQQHGYYTAHVVAQRQELDADHVRVTYDIRRGSLGEISTIEVRGVPPEIERSLLAGLDLASQEREPHGLDGMRGTLIDWLPRPLQEWLELDTFGRAVEESIERDRVAIQAAVAARGYPEAVVQARLAKRGRGSLTLRFDVATGAQFQLKDIICSGNQALTCDEIRSVLVHKVGGPFMLEALDVERGRVLSLYAESGFPYADAGIESDFDDGGRPVLRVAVVEGQHVRLGAVLVDGLVRTNRAVIARELALRLDAPLEPRAVDEGVRRLRRTGLFSRVNRTYLGAEQQDERLGVRVNLEERNTLTLDSSLNFSTSELLGLESELRERNLFGLMVDTSAQGRFGLFIGRHTYLRGNVGWPRIWGAPLTLSLSSGYDLAERPTKAQSFLDNLRFDADVKRTQSLFAKLNLDVSVTTAITVSGRYEFALDYEKYVARVTGEDPLGFGPPVRTGSVSAFFNYRELDNPFDPRRGLQLSAGTKLGSVYLGGQSNFLVPSAGVQVYRTIDRVTVAASLRGAYGILLDTDLGIAAKRFVPERDLILAGGDRSVRGHEDASIGLHEQARDQSGELLYRNASGDSRHADQCQPYTDEVCTAIMVIDPGLVGTVANLELRTTVVRQLWIGDLQWALFVDGAYVADALPDVRDPALALVTALTGRTIGVGVGTGLRYVTPVGPIILDWAVDPLHLPANRIHVQFGYAF